MDDSMNSRTAPEMTRRKVLFTSAAVLSPAASINVEAQNEIQAEVDTSLLALWREWNTVHRRRCELTVLQQNLEAKLCQSPGIPKVALHIPGREQAVFAHSSQEVERLLSRADLAEMRSKAVEELTCQQAVWDMKGWELGYNQACEEEVKADRMEWELAETLWSISAGSLLGVVAKIDCVIEMTGPDVFLQEIPAKVLRLVLSDLKRIISVSPEPYRP